MYEGQRLDELRDREEEERREALRHAIIEQERMKLLKHHASRLLGFLPKVTPLNCLL